MKGTMKSFHDFFFSSKFPLIEMVGNYLLSFLTLLKHPNMKYLCDWISWDLLLVIVNL